MIIQQMDSAKVTLTVAEDALREAEEEANVSENDLEEKKQELSDRKDTLGKRVTRKRSIHTGVDIPAPSWPPLLAAAELILTEKPKMHARKRLCII